MVGLLVFVLTLLLSACSLPHSPAPVLRDAEIHEDTVWSERVVIDGSVRVVKGATLTLRPGTEVLFVRRDADRDGLGDGTLIVEGRLQALGTPAEPIRFASAASDPRPGDWLEIRVDFSRDVHLRHCILTDSAYTLHAHFTRAVVEDCTIRGNIDGSRLGQANVVIRNCLIEKNRGKGVNFRNATVELRRNIIRGNGSGVFLFETDRDSTIAENNIYGNGDNLRLGDFFTGQVQTSGNWWGTADVAEAAGTIHDRRRDPAIEGDVRIDPVPGWIFGTGPSRTASFEKEWSFPTNGFVDAGPVAHVDRVVTASWDGRVAALDPQGGIRWRFETGEVVDATPAVDETAAYVQTWQRRVLALSREDGTALWDWRYPPSPADDHRQGGLVRHDELLLVPAWNGTLYALDPTSGRTRWQFEAGQPLRAAPAVERDRIYQPSGGGTLSSLDLAGRLCWQVHFRAPLLATPALTPEGPIAVSRSGEVVALDREGRERWRRSLNETCYYSAPVFADGAIFLATAAGSLWKLAEASGRTIWQRSDLGPVYATPHIRSRDLLVGDNAGVLHLVDADSGDRLARFAAEGAIQSGVTAFAGRLLFGSRDGSLYALQYREDAGNQRHD